MVESSGALKFLNGNALRRWVKLESIAWDVQRFGFERGFIDATDVVTLALARLNSTAAVSPQEAEVALLLSDEVCRVPELLSRAPEPDREMSSHVWAFAGLTELRSAWATFDQPWQQVADVIEVLEEPVEYSGLIFYEFVPFFSKAPGTDGLLRKLDMALAEDAIVLGV